MNNPLTGNLSTISNRDSISPVLSGPLQSLRVNLNCTMPYSELARLCQSIDNALPNQESHVVQFVSAYDGEGAEVIALETATVAATMIGKRVLFLDATGAGHNTTKLLANAVQAPQDIPLQETYIGIAENQLAYAAFRGHGEGGLAFANVGAVKKLLDTLRQSYDLIIVNSTAVLSDVFSSALAKAVDGSILVVKAESTRAPVAEQAKRVIQENGGRLIGAVLNKRRYHIPQRIYQLLYQRGNF